MAFRRNFDAELVETVKGHRPHTAVERHGTTTPTSIPDPPRLIVIAKSPRVLGDLLQFRCDIKPVGGDWLIRTTTKTDQNAIVALLQRQRIHGVLRRLPKGPQEDEQSVLSPAAQRQR